MRVWIQHRTEKEVKDVMMNNCNSLDSALSLYIERIAISGSQHIQKHADGALYYQDNANRIVIRPVPQKWAPLTSYTTITGA